jgi:hypothetical protein
MRTSKAIGARLHDVLHRLPGMPVHDQAAEPNANAAAWQHSHPQHSHPQHSHLRNPHGHHKRQPRVLAGWQGWLGRRFGQEQ